MSLLIMVKKISIFLLFTVPFWYACEDKNTDQSEHVYWLMDVVDGGKITTSDGDGQVISTTRFLIRGKHTDVSPAGEWEIDIQMYTYFDMAENGADAEGYYSGKLYYQTLSMELPKLTLGILDPETSTSYHYGITNFQLPFFVAEPGPYHYVVTSDDGTTLTFSGSQHFMVGWPNKLSIHFGGSSSSNCSVVRVVADMIDADGLTVSDLTLHGNLYKFSSESEMNNWTSVHPQNDYLQSPELIPF